MKRIIHEPLLHFLLLGAAIFVAYSLVSKGSGGEPGKIVITQGQLASMLEELHRHPATDTDPGGMGGVDPRPGA